MVYFLNDEQLWIPYCVNDKTKKKDCIELEKVCPFLGVLSGHLLLGAFMCSCTGRHMSQFLSYQEQYYIDSVSITIQSLLGYKIIHKHQPKRSAKLPHNAES